MLQNSRVAAFTVSELLRENQQGKGERGKITSPAQIWVNDSLKEKLCFTQFSTRMAVWLLLTFFICLYNQLSSIHSIITY